MNYPLNLDSQNLKCQLNKEVEKFKNAIPDIANSCINDSIGKAIIKAYNDASRAFSGISKSANDDKKKAITELGKNLNDYFSREAPKSESEFDKKHEILCLAWSESFRNTDFAKYGKAQKVVNMAFKYLYCCADANNKDKSDYFKFCHMPLDSFTLEWIKREFNLGEIPKWSKLNKGDPNYDYQAKDKSKKSDYYFYVTQVRKYIEQNKLECSPLQLEFIVWPEMIKSISAEDFLISLENPDRSRKTEIKKMSIDKKYKQIAERLKDKT